ncbi:ERI1 exoribonuclease 2 [Mizuhopecten yessoensis]|uniref:ERI1 exoribonuclease 2 n=1 Tax=Mizuhopecten yessoensis TaxID=6573 RepID=A0A210PN18_MIZYE|nr:ERI1 exoribonuclease 2 [Mizuhopecten yessoensis]
MGELGLLRKRTLSASSGSKCSRSPSQPFEYLIVLDFESTCWKEKKFQTQEIIEFPAVLLNTATGDIESEFQYYVQPHEHPILSDFCHELTGITQELVDEGIPLRLCLKKFSKWLDGLCRDKGIAFSPVLRGRQSSSKAATFVTWSDWDLGVCLFNECRRKQLLKPPQLNSWIDLRATYRKFYNRRPQGLNGALQDLGITFEGRQHSGLHDSRNTARLAWRMAKDGCVLTTTKSLLSSLESGVKMGLPKAMPVDSSTAVTKLVSGEHHIAVRETLPAVQALHSPSTSPCNKRRKTDTRLSPCLGISHSSPTRKTIMPTAVSGQRTVRKTSDSREIVTMVSSPRSAKSKIPVRSPKAAVNRKLPSTTKISIVDQIYRDPSHEEISTADLLSTPNVKKQLSTTGLRSRDNSITCNTQHLNQTSNRNRTVFQTPQNCKTTIPNIQCNVSASRSVKLTKNLSISTSFKTPSHVGHPQSRTSNSSLVSLENTAGQKSLTSFCGFVTPTNSSIKTPNSTTSSMKGTPPLCGCGKRSKRRMAQTPGPNMGRFFFTCGAGSRPSNPQDKRKGCEFFKWESTVGTHINSSYSNSYQSSTNRSNTSLPFKQVGMTKGFPQRKSLGVRSAGLRPPIR